MGLDRSQVERWGLLRAFWAAFAARCQSFALIAHVIINPLDRAKAVADSDEFSVRVATAEELSRAIVDMPDQLDQPFIDRATARGDWCVGVFDQAKLVAILWVSVSDAPHDGHVWVGVTRPYIYGYKSYVDPRYRGQRMTARMTDFLHAQCAGQGYTHSIGFIATHNYPSVRAAKHAGAEFIGLGGYLVLFGRVLPFRTARVKAAGYRFYDPD